MCALGARVCDVEQEASCYLMLNVEIPLLHVAVGIVGHRRRKSLPQKRLLQIRAAAGRLQNPTWEWIAEIREWRDTAIERTDIRSSDAV